MRKILAIDGGGIKGVFPASFLASVERDLRAPLASYFDLIVGTSTGGIVALGLGAGVTASDILRFYETKGPVIFGGNRVIRWLRQWASGKFDSLELEKALSEVFGTKRIGESSVRLVIPSQNLENGEVHIFKTAHHERFVKDYKLPMVTAALATSAAPTYFPTYRAASGSPLIDGGTWANNPSAVAAVEALGVLGWDPRDTLMLTISCTSSPVTARLARTYSMGRAYWAAKLMPILAAGQSSGALGMAQLLLGHDNIFRVDPHVEPGRFGLDKAVEIESLKGLGDSEARKAAPHLQRFFEVPAEPFVPCHSIQ